MAGYWELELASLSSQVWKKTPGASWFVHQRSTVNGGWLWLRIWQFLKLYYYALIKYLNMYFCIMILLKYGGVVLLTYLHLLVNMLKSQYLFQTLPLLVLRFLNQVLDRKKVVCLVQISVQREQIPKNVCPEYK